MSDSFYDASRDYIRIVSADHNRWSELWWIRFDEDDRAWRVTTTSGVLLTVAPTYDDAYQAICDIDMTAFEYARWVRMNAKYDSVMRELSCLNKRRNDDV